MEKLDNKGYMLVETLIVTTFVAGILLFLFIQFSNLNKNYEDAFKYNTVEGLYALEDIKNYILNDSNAYENIKENISNNGFVDITDCSLFTYENYCKELIDLEGINNILVTVNNFKDENINIGLGTNVIEEFNTSVQISIEDEDLNIFIDKINASGTEKYRLIAKFKNNTFATIRFGE